VVLKIGEQTSPTSIEVVEETFTLPESPPISKEQLWDIVGSPYNLI
jgi:hypothetical protein